MDCLKIAVNKGVQVDFFQFFFNFTSPSYLFEFVKEVYTSRKLEASILDFQSAFEHFERKTAELFNQELLDILTNDISILRKIGCDLIANKKYGLYNFQEILDLSEHKQELIIDTLLCFPYPIEKKFPSVLELRYSSFDNVKQLLINFCMVLIEDFGETVIKLLKLHLNLNDNRDKDFFTPLQKQWDDVRTNIELKQSLLELNPFINEKKLCDYYYKIDERIRYKNIINIKNNILLEGVGMFKNINIIRGSGFKSEKNPKINNLGKVTHSFSIAKRYATEPEKYDFQYQIHFLHKNVAEKNEEPNN